MPIKIPNKLPAAKILEEENIFVMNETRAMTQDIRPLKILLLNLMPTKIETETQLSRLLGNTPLQVELELLQMQSYKSKNVSEEHMLAFYKTFDDVKSNRYDGLIITGAPVETLEFDEVEYWEELKQIMDWGKTHVHSKFYICWGAQAALYHNYGIEKLPLDEKMFGLFSHKVNNKLSMWTRGFDDCFMAPHSRHTSVDPEAIRKINDLEIIAESDEAGVYLIKSRDSREFYVMGHSEYDPYTLKKEYDRDVNLGRTIKIPQNYFVNDDPKNEVLVTWRSHANLLFSNWLNYYVYQSTPFDINAID